MYDGDAVPPKFKKTIPPYGQFGINVKQRSEVTAKSPSFFLKGDVMYQPLKTWCDEAYVELCRKYPDSGGKFTKSQIIDMLFELKDLDKRTGLDFYEKIWKKYYK